VLRREVSGRKKEKNREDAMHPPGFFVLSIRSSRRR
jgi:hypothetical protein